MTLHVPPAAACPLDALDAWFRDLGPSYVGRIAPDDPLLGGSPGSAGWRVRTLGRELIVVVDRAFPFSRPSVYLRDVVGPMPHVESGGKLCLRNPAVPSDPVVAVASALGEARSLLRAIAAGEEDDDFREDFGLYWVQGASDGPRIRLSLPRDQGTGHVTWFETNEAAYVFGSGPEARRWWRHRYGADLAKPRRAVAIELATLPRPEGYPATAADLWDLIERRSEHGTGLLEDLFRQIPKRFPVVLLGTAPSGRRHAVSVFLSRSPDDAGNSLKRREIERGHARGQAPVEALYGRYVLTRLKSDALHAANSRLPYAERDRLAAARVAVVGCGALGSGVARLLAKSGVGHLVLIDADTLGWENIRRHRLGADHVGHKKAIALARTMERENPDIGSVTPHGTTVQALFGSNPTALADLDLVVSCTADWSANAALDHRLPRRAGGPAALYAWMEAHALASHAVLIMPGGSFRAGYDPAGHPRMAASTSRKPVPVECGGATTPFGAVELAHAETLAARLALDFLRGRCDRSAWRTWLADAASLEAAEGSWTRDWIAARGEPGPLGEIAAGPWWE